MKPLLKKAATVAHLLPNVLCDGNTCGRPSVQGADRDVNASTIALSWSTV